jgi:hypothetical protein
MRNLGERHCAFVLVDLHEHAGNGIPPGRIADKRRSRLRFVAGHCRERRGKNIDFVKLSA